MRRIVILAAMAALCFGATSAFAGTQDNAVVALHVGEHLLKGDTPCDWGNVSCSNMLVNWPLATSGNVYLLVARGEAGAGIAALSCGVAYDAATASGVDCYGFTFCASGLQFPNDGGNGDFPAALGGNRMTWDGSVDCQTTEIGGDGVHALAGSFYVYAYSDDIFQITANNNLQSGPEFQVGDCSNSITDLPLIVAGAVGFGAFDGFNPCGVVPVQPTTWGSIKTQY